MSELYMQLDEEKLDRILALFSSVTPRVVEMSLKRAQRRTEGTIRQQASRLMNQRLKLVSGAQKRLRKRIQAHLKPATGKDVSELKFWFGLNDLDADLFRGGVKRVKGGLMIRGTYCERAFIAIIGGKRRIRQRSGASAHPIKNVKIPISDEITIALEDELFERIPDIFLHHFETDMRGRTAAGLTDGSAYKFLR